MDGTILAAAALALLVGTTALWFRRVRAVRLPANRTGFVVLWLSAAVLGALAFAQGPGLLGGVAAGFAVVGGTFLLVLIAISGQKVAPDAVAVGDPLPAFECLDEDGEVFSSDALAGERLLLKFFRGHW